MSLVSCLRVARSLALVAATIAVVRAERAFAESATPVVVELFTSQGCAACPPANEYFAELARRPNVVALSFHVDYWNYLGWADPYSSKKATYRQKMYAMALRQTGVFTPQIVIQGRRGEVGSDRAVIERAIEEARKSKLPVLVSLEKQSPDRVRVRVGPSAGTKDAEIWLYLMSDQVSTKILRGENQGRTLLHRNVVREWRQIGQLTGEAFTSELALAADRADKVNVAAVLVQQPRGGPILGAAIVYLDK